LFESINEIEYLFAKAKSKHLGFVLKVLNLLTVLSPPQIILASTFCDSSDDINSEFSYFINKNLLKFFYKFFWMIIFLKFHIIF
jgi:hypothetical protein